jgi:hypothetical protein
MEQGHAHWVFLFPEYYLDMQDISAATYPEQRITGFIPAHPHNIIKAPTLHYERERSDVSPRYFLLGKFKMPDLDNPLEDFWTGALFPKEHGSQNCCCNNSATNDRYDPTRAAKGYVIPNRSAYLKNRGHDSALCMLGNAPAITDRPAQCLNISGYDKEKRKNIENSRPNAAMQQYVRHHSRAFNKLIGKPEDYIPPASAATNND